MTDRAELDLLVDLARLLKKHGPDTFEQLANHISSPEVSEHLLTLLSTASRVARKAAVSEPGQRSRGKGDSNLRARLIALQATEPEKAQTLLRFHDGLVAKTLLPTMRDIQGFVVDIGLPPLKAESRSKAISPLINLLQPLPVEILRSRLSKIKPVDTAGDRSLEGWSDIILNRGRRTRSSDE